MSHEHEAPAGLGFCARCATPLEPRLQEDRPRPTCPRCGFVVYLDPKVAVAVVIGGPPGVLLVRRNIDPGRGKWSFPAGYVNRGEVLEEAALREVLEELGVVVRLEGLVGAYSAASEPVVLLVYAALLLDGEPRPDGHEVSEAAWFAVDALPPLAFHHDRRILEDWARRVAPALDARPAGT